eukprot:tig00000215_g18621.t1
MASLTSPGRAAVTATDANAMLIKFPTRFGRQKSSKHRSCRSSFQLALATASPAPEAPPPWLLHPTTARLLLDHSITLVFFIIVIVEFRFRQLYKRVQPALSRASAIAVTKRSAIAPEYSELLQVRRTSQRQRLQSCFKFVAPANANACIQAASGACRLDFAVMENKCAENPLYPEDNLYPPPDSPRHPQGLCIDYFALRARSTSSFWSWWRRRRSRALRLVRAGAALSRREPPLFLPIALNSSAYALMRVARDGGAAPSTSRCPAPLRISSKTEARQVLRRLFSHTLDPPRRAAPPSAAALAAALLRQAVLMYPGAVRPLLENYNVKPDSGAPGLGRPTQAALFDDDEPAASVELPPLTAGIGPWTSSML